MGETVVNPYLVELLSNEKFEHYWPYIEGQLDRVPHIWSYWWTKESIKEFTLMGRFQCWTVGDKDEVVGVVFSQIIHYPAASILQVFLAFGLGMVETVGVIDATLSRFGAANGCDWAEITGRPGWEPRLREFGFRVPRVTLIKRLEPIRMN
jgi:hypothetical protein